MTRFALTILGINSALPAYGRHPSAQVLQVNEKFYLIDCGEGTQMRMNDFGIRRNRIGQVFISHLHGDHVFGLAGLLTSLALNDRRDALDIFSPPGLQQMIDAQFPYGSGSWPFPLRYHLLDPGRHDLIFDNEDLQVWTIPLVHSVPTCGFLFREKPRPRNMKKEALARYDIPFSDIPAIKAGGDWTSPGGQLIPNEALTLDPLPARAYAYCSDTAFNERIIPIIQGVDMLYHESTYCEDHAGLAEAYFHTTARQAATLAREASVGRLILGHYSARYRELSSFLEEAKEVFSRVETGQEGRVYEVP